MKADKSLVKETQKENALAQKNPLSRPESEQLLVRIEELQDKLTKAQASIASKEKEREAIIEWGDFRFADVERLREAGYQVSFFNCAQSRYEPKWEKEYNAILINNVQSLIHFITITPVGSKITIDADHAKLPAKDYRQLCQAIEQENEYKKTLEAQLVEIGKKDFYSLQCLQAEIENETSWSQVKIETKQEAGDKLMLLEGWIPTNNSDVMEQSLKDDGYYYQQLEVNKEGDPVPIKLKNNKFARLFEPIGEMYTFPKFAELDMTPFFAPFYMLFFGLCLGDAGYGLLIVIAAIVARFYVKPAMKPLLTLAALLGASTTFCGAMGGTLFGIALPDMDWAWLTTYKKFVLDSNQLFNLALILGVVQLLFAWIVKVFNIAHRYGWAYTLDTIGWILLAIGGGALYFISDAGMVSPEMVTYLIYGLAGVCFVLIFLLNNPKRNPLINFGAGLWNSFNMATGVIGDVLSYMRLFVVGLSSGVMGHVFNQLAIQLSGDIPVISPLFMVIILLFGHSINLFIACLGSFVHPLRLTFVEFYKNAGFEGGGKPYKPFKQVTVES
jgi:V/A-type H+-transporting ATPase subunit I